MKTLLALAIILTTIATEAQVVNIHEPGKVYAEIPHTYTPITGYRWPRYHTRTHAHYAEGWRQADTMPVCEAVVLENPTRTDFMMIRQYLANKWSLPIDGDL